MLKEPREVRPVVAAEEGETRPEAEVVPLLQHLPAAEAVTVAVIMEEQLPLVVVVAVPLVVAVAEARRPSRAPRRWLRNWVPHLLLLVVAEEDEAGAQPPLVVVLLLVARTTRRLGQHQRRRPKRCFLRIRALEEVGKLLRMGRRSSPDR